MQPPSRQLNVLSPLQVSSKWEALIENARRCATARQQAVTVPITPMFDILPGGLDRMPAHVREVLQGIHAAHDAA